MHRVENTQYCTVHGGKARRREEFLTGQQVTDPDQKETRGLSAAQRRDRKASGTRSTYFKGAGGAIYYPEQETGALSVTSEKTATRNPLQDTF